MNQCKYCSYYLGHADMCPNLNVSVTVSDRVGTPLCDRIAALESEVTALKAENKRLRFALEIIASDEHLCPSAAQNTAQRALDGHDAAARDE